MRIRRLAYMLLAATLVAGCVGEDYTPVYFPPPEDQADLGPQPGESVGGRECTLSFTSQLCVTIKSENIDVGTDPEDALCAEVAPFPIHISGSTAKIEGGEFPDIAVEGHGLPAPITINGRGEGDGSGNVGEGTIDASGNITVEGFSFFILALGMVAEIPNLTLTTGSAEELPHLPAVTGSPPDASGAMTLVTGTVLGHTIEAADAFLLGASLTAVFTGSISPTLAECTGGVAKSMEVKKLFIDEKGWQTEVPIPDGKLMEISQGTYIAENDADIGQRYEAHAKFRAKNIGNKPIKYQIPPRKGPFHLSSLDPLTGTLNSQQSIILNVTFRPTMTDAEPGSITEPLSIGYDLFLLSATALSKSGQASVSTVDDQGDVTAPNVGGVDVGQAEVPANGERAFFLCQEIECHEEKAWTDCRQCPDPTTSPCSLLTVSTAGQPLGEVDSQCNLMDPDAIPLLTIDLKGTSDVSLIAQKQVMAIRNKGVMDMHITDISIQEVPGSQSTGQFVLPPGAIFVAKNFADISDQVRQALEKGNAQGTPLPFTLPPYQPGFDETTVYVVVIYQPNDLAGADGSLAGVGSAVQDKAILRIITDTGEITTVVAGSTTITESPALELYFKTSVGARYVPDGQAFSFKGITGQTIDLAVPVFLRVADTSPNSLRVTSISVEGEDQDYFRWLSTAEEIASINPPEGKGKRCSIPIVDASTGEMVDESFDLNPVSPETGGFDMVPGAYSIETMPLFGCIDFHREEGGALTKRLFEANLVVEAVELSASGTTARNPDGSLRQTTLSAKLLAAIDPRTGKMVYRITQTLAGIMNPQFPAVSAISTYEEKKEGLASGRLNERDLPVFTSAFILDPFDEMPITTSDGQEVVSTPNDGITAVFRAMDNHPVSKAYDDEWLFDYASLLHDGSLAPGSRGIYEDYPNVPEDARANSWRVFTGSLSYPGPLGPPALKPQEPSECVIVNPCDPEDLKLFTEAGIPPGERGACAFFYATGARFDSPAFHTAEEMPGGEYINMCDQIDEPQTLYDIDMVHYSVDGRITTEEMGLRFFGPTFFHNPGGPFGPRPPLDEVFHLAFTSGVIKPQASPEDLDVIPDKRINLAKGEFKINLTDTTLTTPPICKTNTNNATRNGQTASTWKYLEGLIFKDEEATIPAGCPEEDNDYTGGSAYLRGRDLDPETGVMTVVTVAKFGSSEDLSFAFKDVMVFFVLNGWVCNPLGSEEDFEGSRCYDAEFNERDATAQISIIE